MRLDTMLIEQIQLSLVSAYLSQQGWQVAEAQPDKSVRWTHPKNQPGELTVPAEAASPETAERKRELVNTLAASEGRSPQEVLLDLIHTGADRLRVNLLRPETIRGTLALDNAARLNQGVNKLLVALSWAMLSPGAVLAGKKPTQVARYVRSLEIAPIQAETGYTLHVLSPLDDIDEDSFSRQTLLALGKTLSALRTALDTHTLTSETVGKLIEQFVTADLCEALVSILGKPDAGKRSRMSSKVARTVRFQFEWSPALAAPAEAPNTIEFPSELAEQLQELAEFLRETPPHENFQIRGWVIDLKRSEQTGVGKITLNNQNRDVIPKVVMELEPEQYDLAIQAHRDDVPLLCVGTLVKVKRTYNLVSPTLALAQGFAGNTEPSQPETSLA